MEVLIYSFIRDEGNVIVFGATRTDNGYDIYVTIEHRYGEAICKLLDFEQPVVEIDEWQIIGNVPVAADLTRLRYFDILETQ
jgi:hypothetical protein